MSYWIFATSYQTVGESHSIHNVECQDAYFLKLSQDKNWVVAVVCDGAGSAKFASKGAKLVAEKFGSALCSLVEEIKLRKPGNWINDFIIQAVIAVRNQLRLSAGKDEISDYHTTIVASLLGPTGGFVVHIGDGAAFGSVVEQNGDTTILNRDFKISLPENGEYSNETFFVTEGDWVKHLRITPLPKLDWFALGSDGACSIVLKNDRTLQPGVLDRAFKLISENPQHSGDVIKREMERTEWQNVTDDDRTILLMANARALVGSLFKIEEENFNEIKFIKKKQITSDSKPTAVAGKIDASNSARNRRNVTAAILGVLLLISSVFNLIVITQNNISTNDSSHIEREKTKTTGPSQQDRFYRSGEPF